MELDKEEEESCAGAPPRFHGMVLTCPPQAAFEFSFSPLQVWAPVE
jgi:hypothetical protein